ncbi:PAS domain S-box protein [Fulvivirga sp. 29W222]|uniref:histidine kinase n=1 Tax=Fulvivirga marina TaxID=2494733 RepID=A0A937FYX4_9BACT|nr:PAS domain S-box protein [Fulvivirga marina]MBL6447053.1 PAS domain S-box protein [Fulvivirga marina]
MEKSINHGELQHEPGTRFLRQLNQLIQKSNDSSSLKKSVITFMKDELKSHPKLIFTNGDGVNNVVENNTYHKGLKKPKLITRNNKTEADFVGLFKSKLISTYWVFPVLHNKYKGHLYLGFSNSKQLPVPATYVELALDQVIHSYSLLAEKEQTQSQYELYESVCNCLSDIILVLDKNLVINEVNRNTSNYKQDQLVGKNLLDFQPDIEEKNKTVKHVEYVFKHKKETNFDTKILSPEGLKHFSILGKPIFDSDSELIGCLILARDITSEAISQRAPIATEKLYRDIVENANSCIIKLRADGTIGFANKFTYEYFGFNENELIGKPVIGTIVPEFDSLGNDLSQMVNDVLSDPEAFGICENENVKKDGTRVWMSWTNHPFNQNGNLIEVLSIGNDITQLKIKEHEILKQSQSIDDSHLSIICVDMNGIMTYVNHGAVLINGYSREEMLGNHITMLYPDDQHEHLANEIMGKLIQNDSHRTEAIGITKQGNRINLDISLSLLKDEKGIPYGMIGYAADITENKKVEKELHQLALIVENAEDIIGISDLDGNIQFVNDYAHRLLGMGDDYQQTHILDYFDDEGKKQIKETISPAIATEGRWAGESKFKNISTGELIDVLFDIFIINDPLTGKPMKMATVSKNISNLKNQRDKLEASELALKQAQEIGKVGSWELDIVENKLYWSEQVYRLLELPINSGPANYDVFLGLVHPDDHDEVNAAFLDHIHNNSEYSIVHRVITKKGNLKYIHEQCKTTRDKNGNALRSLGTATDITEYKNIELELEKYRSNLEALVKKRTKELEVTNQKLNESQQKYRSLVQSTSMGIGIAKGNKISFANPALFKMFGYSSLKSFLSKSILDHASENGRSILRERLTKVEQGKPLNETFICEYLKANGKPFKCQVSVKDIIYEGEKCRHASFVDITELKETEEKLRDSQSLYKLLADNVTDIICIFNSNFENIYVSPSITQVLGYSLREFKNLAFLDCVHDDDAQLVRSELSKAIEQQNEILVIETRCKTKKGQFIWLEHSLKLSYDIEGNFEQFISTSHNTHERVLAQEKLKILNADLVKSNNKFKDLTRELTLRIEEVDQKNSLIKRQNKQLVVSKTELEILNTKLSVRNNAINEIAILSATDHKGDLLEVNRKFEEISGYDEDEVIGQSHRIVNSGYHSKEFFKDMWNTIIAGKIWRGEVKNKAKDGSYFWLLKTIVPFKINGLSDNYYYFSLSSDITKLKEREAELEESKKETEKASRIKEDFLSIMSHEIRTPLNSVIGLSEILLNKNPKKSQLKMLKTLKLSADNLMRLITDILDFTKIQADKVEIIKQPFNLHDLLLEAKNTFAILANEKGVLLRLFLCTDLPKYVNGDVTRLKQIINNLVLNAIKFTDSGEVTIQARMVKLSKSIANIRFTIKDTGIGINESDKKIIFELFEQSKMNISHQKGGTGLGLAIVKKLVGLFDGKIDVESEVGQGSSFHVEIPLELTILDEANQSAPISKRLSLRNEFNGKRILYIEDVYTNQFLVQTFLEDLNIVCDIANNGEEAINKLSKRKYDLILMDVQMPGMDGYETSMLIRRGSDELKNIPIIAFTADISEMAKNKIVESGMNDIITKPMNSQHLLDLLDKYLNRVESHRNLPFNFQYYERAFQAEPLKLKEFKDILKQDLKIFNANIKKYSDEGDLVNVKREMHKISPIISQLQHAKLLTIFNECQSLEKINSRFKSNIKIIQLKINDLLYLID